MSVSKKKKFSKKNKASWRKHIDIKDVEDFLEEKRLEERIGKISEKKDDELFTIDTVREQKLLTPKEKRKSNARRPPKNISILNNTSKVEDPIVKRNHVKQKRNGRNVLEEILNPSKSKKVLQANKDRNAYYTKLDQSKQKKIVFEKDIWEEQDANKVEILKNEWIRKDVALHYLKNVGTPMVNTHDSIRHKTSLTKSFEVPHPGTSYNPRLKDHQDLLNAVIEREDKIIKTEQHLKRVTSDMFEKVSAEKRDLERAKEMASGLPIEGKEGGSEESNSEEDMDVPYRAVNPPVLNKKKDKKSRRKQKEQRLLRLEAANKKEHKQKITDIHRIKKIEEEIMNNEEELNQLKKSRNARKRQKKFEPKRIAKLKYEEPEIDVNMMEDIFGNLRNVKNEGSLLIDRFKNFQRRNILPPSVDVGPRKRRKIKRFVRSSHKNTELAKKDL